MTRAEFEQYYEVELNLLEKRRYHLLMPLNIRTMESNGWKYKGYEQHQDRWVFVGSEGRVGVSDSLFRVTVPKDTEVDLIWEWDWRRETPQGNGTRMDESGPQTRYDG